MSPGVQPALQDVLEAFMLDADEQGALARYLRDYPQFTNDLVDLAHQLESVDPDELPTLGEPCQEGIRTGWEKLKAAWPAPDRNLFANLSPKDYGRVAEELSVPRQILSGIRDGKILVASVPQAFLRRLAVSLQGTADELRSSIGGKPALASYKAEKRPEAKEAVSFEQALIDAGVPDDHRARLLTEDQ